MAVTLTGEQFKTDTSMQYGGYGNNETFIKEY